VAMKPHGGKMLALIRPSLPARCGWRLIRCREFTTKWALTPPTTLTGVGADQINAKRDRPIEKRGPDSKTKPIIATGVPMTSFRQIDANRRNARKSTGPTTEEGKHRSRRNAVRRGLTAETVISALEDSEDYKAFEAAIIADYDAQSAVERELLLRLASLPWRLRRATTMETGLFEFQADQLSEFRQARQLHPDSREVIYALLGRVVSDVDPIAELARCFLRLANLPNFALGRCRQSRCRKGDDRGVLDVAHSGPPLAALDSPFGEDLSSIRTRLCSAADSRFTSFRRLANSARMASSALALRRATMPASAMIKLPK
jgi:hypothetical protein